ncbi:unnamed protein product [Linum tenue]|uniref:Import inner membrane translocase subunit n=1 Tax=Linum tenue TaxID=586396 RepID=A0AAV0R3I8_9ROSI|nr:unnamed protein product [Linum tenue]CAI0552250.1 unnamed protein product [Linum tenue]
MSKPSPNRIVQGLLRLHHSRSSATACSPRVPLPAGSLSRPHSSPSQFSTSTSYPPPLKFSPFASQPASSTLPKLPNPSTSFLARTYCYGLRHYSFKAPSSVGKRVGGGEFAKRAFEKPAEAVTSVLSKYRRALGLHLDAFWKRNSLFLFGVGAVVLCALLWRIMFGVASTFVHLSEGMAKYGFLALSTAIVAFAGLYVRSRLTINPDKVYRMAMTRLNTDAGILEIMGAPLAGTDLRAYVMSGGGIRMKNFKPTRSNKRCFLIFPVQGSERKGLVSVEVKKKRGQYDMRLLAVDIPMASGPDQRLFLIGDDEEYKIGGGIIGELRDPVIRAMSATKEFDDLDQIEEQEDAERELQEAERKRQEEIEKLEKDGSS